MTMVSEAENDGELTDRESELIRSAIEFDDVEVEEILTPRVDVIAVEDDLSLDEVADTFAESGYSRLPVYHDTIDNIIGVVHEKDFYMARLKKKETKLEDLVNTLGGSVGRDGLAAQLAHHGADVDDLALALFHHVRQNGLGAVEGTAYMDIDDPHKVGVAHLDHGHALHQTGVVYQNVHRADLDLDLCHHGVDGVLVGNVCHIAVGVDAGSLVGGHAFSKLVSEEQLKQMTAPHLAMPSAMEKPMPWAPPVIRATLPCRLNADRSMRFSFFTVSKLIF